MASKITYTQFRASQILLTKKFHNFTSTQFDVFVVAGRRTEAISRSLDHRSR